MQHIEWERYWYDREATPALERGVFLFTPVVTGLDHMNADVMPLDGYGDMPVLVLLGEPGIGKTEVVRQRARLHPEVHVVDLPDEVTPERIEARLGKALAELDHTRRVVEVFFDGLDEAMVRYTSPDKWLGAILGTSPKSSAPGCGCA